MDIQGKRNIGPSASYAAETDIVNPEAGYLNGNKVTVQAIEKAGFSGIQVSPEEFAAIPENTRPVKIALEDFNQWLSKCRPVKAVENLLMSQESLVKTQGLEVISNAHALMAIKPIADDNKKYDLADDIENFNIDLGRLDHKKNEFYTSKIENDDFKEKYKTLLAIADGDLTALRKGLVIVLPAATEDGDPQCVCLDGESSIENKNAANELVNIFKSSEAYAKYSNRIDHVNKLEDEYKKLKISLAEQAEKLKIKHEKLIGEQVEGDKAVLLDMNQSLKAETLLKKNEASDVSEINELIKSKTEKADALVKTIEEFYLEINAVEKGIDNFLSEMKTCNTFLNPETDKLTQSGDRPAVLHDHIIFEIRRLKEQLLEEIEFMQNQLASLTESLEVASTDYEKTLHDIDALKDERDKKLPALPGRK
ncbi:hypothetical protein [Endozoicomonas sp. ONNA2]|uniref:hypothetical protein n=1 Tax=Endozoicomonas sp. ONNA2 TaxID=2828741 RepID=UPI0021475F75|nr:hypothetical protein [Endozoicomonas sp. ONNA2]